VILSRQLHLYKKATSFTLGNARRISFVGKLDA